MIFLKFRGLPPPQKREEERGRLFCWAPNVTYQRLEKRRKKSRSYEELDFGITLWIDKWNDKKLDWPKFLEIKRSGHFIYLELTDSLFYLHFCIIAKECARRAKLRWAHQPFSSLNGSAWRRQRLQLYTQRHILPHQDGYGGVGVKLSVASFIL